MNSPTDPIARAAKILSGAKRVAVLTGAGISAESGLATFRGAGGLWEGHRVEDVATPRAFARNPLLVWRFYNLRREALAKVAPNPGHHALVALERRFGADAFAVVTQNVDGLHQQAGSQTVFEIHGTIRHVRCTGCEAITDRGCEPLEALPICACGQLLRPNVVWFEEALPEDVWKQAEDAVARCDVFLVIGTSAVVYPAAGLIDLARMEGAAVIEVNVEQSQASGRVDVLLLGPSGDVLPQLVSRLAA